MRTIDKVKELSGISTIEAVTTFANNEGEFSLILKNSYEHYKKLNSINEKQHFIRMYEKVFDNFSTTFNVSRCIPKLNKLTILNLIFEKYLTELENSKEAQMVDEFARYLQNNKLSQRKVGSECHDLPLSLVSKVAFLFKPEIFNPYDRFTTKILTHYARESGIGVQIARDYSNFYSVFNKLVSSIEECISLYGCIDDKNFIEKYNINKKLFMKEVDKFKMRCSELKIDDINKLIALRTVDKALMLAGGFEEHNLVCVNKGIVGI